MSEVPAASPVRLLGPAEVRELAARLDVTPTKKLGQNFVHDANTVRRIVRVGGVHPGDVVVEVGPGLGSLTLGILEAGASVVAVEIDGRLAAELPATVEARGGQATAARLTVVHQDALTITELPQQPSRFVANLPYNVSVPIMLQFLERIPSIRSGVVMVQSEVGERLAAAPGSKVYGGPSAKAAWFGRFWTAGNVSRQIFWPVPNVDSILVAFERHAAEPGDVALRARTFAVIDAAFQQRRKMLRQSLSGLFGGSAAASDALIAAGVAPTARGEELDVAAFVEIGRQLGETFDAPGEADSSGDADEADGSDRSGSVKP